eukprot:scaffold145648_cov37-Tisochrysis_lutea.AAC.3
MRMKPVRVGVTRFPGEVLETSTENTRVLDEGEWTKDKVPTGDPLRLLEPRDQLTGWRRLDLGPGRPCLSPAGPPALQGPGAKAPHPHAPRSTLPPSACRTRGEEGLEQWVGLDGRQVDRPVRPGRASQASPPGREWRVSKASWPWHAIGHRPQAIDRPQAQAIHRLWQGCGWV